MMKIVTRADIEAALKSVDLIAAMEEAFRSYSNGEAVVPPVGELLFASPPGEVHIKYGYVRGDDIFVVKIATGFYENPKNALPANSGLVLIFSQLTGEPKAILLDEGLLTDQRTAAAGALACRLLANPDISEVAVLGSGVQARLQLSFLKRVTQCRRVVAWARRPEALSLLQHDLEKDGFAVELASSPTLAVRNADVIITATASSSPLLDRGDIKPGAHIIAIGADTPAKRELTSALIGAADLVVADSRAQCAHRGEIHHALDDGTIASDDIIELGEIIAGRHHGRQAPEQITIADLTGVAVQDLAAAKAILASCSVA